MEALILYFLITPNYWSDIEYETYYIKLKVVYNADPFYFLVGEAFNPHGDYSPVQFTASRRGANIDAVGLSTINTSTDSVPRDYFILSSRWYLNLNLEGFIFNGNVNIHPSGHQLGDTNDYSYATVSPIMEDEYYQSAERYGVEVSQRE